VKLDSIVRWAFWSLPLRALLFVAIFLGAYGRSDRLPIISDYSNFARVVEVFGEASHSEMTNVSKPDFAYALASEIVRVAAGMAAAFLICHVCITLLLLLIARVRLVRIRTAKDFQGRFDEVSKMLADDFLIGEAWAAYAKTFVREQIKDQVRHFATVRPQAYLNASVARDHMFGLRLMPSIPGYFVGLGLLLTFIGLVIALSKAAHGSGTSADDMTASLKELLNAATFKFATSIAGLFASLVLALLFRSYAILIERGFERLCRTLEPRLIYLTSQDIALKSHAAILEQKALLQEMTTAQYMQKLGKALGDEVEKKFGPYAKSASDDRKQGLEELVRQFMETLRGAAGEEMTTLVEVLKTTTETLKNLRQDLSESGEKFAQRMDVASAAFAELIKKAGGDLGKVTDGGRDAIKEAIEALVRASETMRKQLEQNTGEAGAAALAALEVAMKNISESLAAQMEGFKVALIEFQNSIKASGRETKVDAEKVIHGTKGAVEDVTNSIRSSLGELLQTLRSDTERVAAALTSAEKTFAKVADAAKETVDQSNAAAGAFARVADQVDKSSRPLIESTQRIDGAIDVLSKSVSQLSSSIASSQGGMRDLTDALAGNVEKLTQNWELLSTKFDGADNSLGEAIRILAKETESFQERVTKFVVDIDNHLASSATTLNTVATTLNNGVEELSENFGALIKELQNK